jgi:hypothetical protein
MTFLKRALEEVKHQRETLQMKTLDRLKPMRSIADKIKTTKKRPHQSRKRKRSKIHSKRTKMRMMKEKKLVEVTDRGSMQLALSR